MPYGYNFLWSAGRQVAKAGFGLRTGKGAGDVALGAAHDLTASLLSAFNPLGTGPLPQVIAPTAVDPFVQVATNQQFHGGPIQPENFPGGPQKPQSELYFSTVSEASKNIARAMNGWTGGDKFKPGLVSISPEVLDHLASFVTGGAGRFVGQVADIGAKAMKGEAPGARGVPFVRRLVYDEPPSMVNSRYRENLAEVTELYERWKGYQKEAALHPDENWGDKARAIPRPMLEAYQRAHEIDLHLRKMREAGIDREDPRFQKLQRQAVKLIQEARYRAEER
jgi:hypothetical protein